MSSLLYCAQTEGAVSKNIAKVNLPRIIVSPSKLHRTATLGWMQSLHNRIKIFDSWAVKFGLRIPVILTPSPSSAETLRRMSGLPLSLKVQQDK